MNKVLKFKGATLERIIEHIRASKLLKEEDWKSPAEVVLVINMDNDPKILN